MREGSRGIRVLTLSRGILNIQSLSMYASSHRRIPFQLDRSYSHMSQEHRGEPGAHAPPSPVHTQTKSRKLIHAAPVTDDRYPCVPCVSRLLRRLFTGTRLSTAVARAMWPPLSRPRCGPRPTAVGWWVWMVVRFVCAIRVPACARVSRVPCVSRAPPVSFYRYR